jgi:tripartite-type tricarboxylate transporter receptor subunit TctC
MNKRLLLTFILILLVVTGCTNASSSKASEDNEGSGTFPKKSIEVLVGYGAGGSSDSIARIIVNGANKYLPNKQNFVVKNLEGGSGSIGLTELSNANPDGYTIGFSPSGPLTALPHQQKVGYTLNDFDPILKAASIPQMLHVSNDAPWNNFKEWKEYVKDNPGKFKFSSSGNGSEQHLAMEALNQKLGIDTTHVPYDSGATSAGAVSAGEVDASVVFPGMVDGSEGKPLFSFSGEKEGYEDVPTLKEKGVDLAVDVYGGFLAPKGMPEDKKEIIHSAIKQALEDPEVIGELEKLGYPITYADSEDFKEDLSSTFDDNGETMKQMGK